MNMKHIFNKQCNRLTNSNVVHKIFHIILLIAITRFNGLHSKGNQKHIRGTECKETIWPSHTCQ